jgi:membrane protease YdiL (CAAX protease family)
VGVTANNFILVALYISFINSLLEEFFFRGYAFVVLKQHVHKLYAYFFSAILFSLYHVGMMQGWFDFYIYILSMLGLLIGGLIFNYLNDRWDSIYPSWLVHIFANLAINTVGLILFGII